MSAHTFTATGATTTLLFQNTGGSAESRVATYMDNLTVVHHYTKTDTLERLVHTGEMSGLANRFNLYNGNELDESFGLDWYSYGARNYDAQTGRFIQIDPLMDKYNFQTPYAYAANNPIRWIDVNGEEPGNGPFSRKNVRRTKNGQLVATRITARGRRAINTGMALVSALPVTRITGTLIGLGYEGAKAFSGGDNSFASSAVTATGVKGGQAFFQAASENGIISSNPSGTPGTSDNMLKAKGVVKGIGSVLGVASVVSAATSKDTPQELMESLTFQIAELGRVGQQNIVNEGVFNFGNNELTVEQGAGLLNTIYNSLHNVLSGFDLTNEEDKAVATKFLQDNLNDFIKDINRQIEGRDEKDNE